MDELGPREQDMVVGLDVDSTRSDGQEAGAEGVGVPLGVDISPVVRFEDPFGQQAVGLAHRPAVVDLFEVPDSDGDGPEANDHAVSSRTSVGAPVDAVGWNVSSGRGTVRNQRHRTRS